MAITRRQIALIHVARKQLQLTDEQYRAILKAFGGVTSSKELDKLGFEQVMQYMAALGFRSDFTRTFYGRGRGMASPGQLTLIRMLWAEYTHGEGTDATLGKWLERSFKVSAPRFVTADLAPKVITALKKMKARDRRWPDDRAELHHGAGLRGHQPGPAYNSHASAGWAGSNRKA